MDIESAYAELGLSPGASQSEAKAAWRREVSQWHPDRNTSASAPARMQRINLAFEAILRAAGEAAATEQAAPPTDPGGPAVEPLRRAVQRKVRLTLEEAAFGCTKVLRGRLGGGCLDCVGKGYRVVGGHCPQCQGSGAVRQRAWFGWMSGELECEACRGGGIARQACETCAGTRKAPGSRYGVRVRFPHGVRNGDLLQVQTRVEGPRPVIVELSIGVDVAIHPLLQLEADGTLRCEVPVDGFAWIANREIEVPTLGGLQVLRLSRERLSYRLEGQGFPIDRRGPRADQWVVVHPIFPHPLSPDQEILLDQLIATSSGREAARPDERLAAWSAALRKFERGRQART